MVTDDGPRYFPQLHPREIVEALADPSQVSPPLIVGLLYDLLVTGKPNAAAHISRKAELTKTIGQLIRRFPLSVVCEAFSSWRGIPDSIWGAVQNAAKRAAVSRATEESEERKNGTLPSSLFDGLFDGKEARHAAEPVASES